MSDEKLVKLTLVSSPIGCPERQRQTLRGLGLTRVGRTVTVKESPAVKGMIQKIAHMVRVEL